MSRRAQAGTSLGQLIQMAIPLCQAAQQQRPRTGPGRPPQYQDWQLAMLIMVAVLHKRKSKSSQWSFLQQHQQAVCAWLDLPRLPARSTYCQRYTQAHRIFAIAIRLQGCKALQEHVTHARCLAVDKSLIPAHGPVWHPRQRQQNRRPRGLDEQASWGYSPHGGWVWGYSYEAVVSATPHQMVYPLLASADGGSRNEHRSLAEKLPHLPPSTRYVLVDSGYDGNELAEAVEYRANGRRSGRRYLGPLQARAGKPAVGRTIHRGRREQCRQHRAAREAFYRSVRGRRLYRRRGQTVEPFHQWFKQLFELEEQVWHRGLENNRTMLLAAIFIYQLLVRYNFRHGRRNAEIQWILDGL